MPGSRFFMKPEGMDYRITGFAAVTDLAAGAGGQIGRNFWDGTYQKQRSNRNVHN